MRGFLDLFAKGGVGGLLDAWAAENIVIAVAGGADGTSGNVRCEWDGSKLILQADYDFDSDGISLLDEFSDAISACVKDGFDRDIELVSITPATSDSSQSRFQ